MKAKKSDLSRYKHEIRGLEKRDPLLELWKLMLSMRDPSARRISRRAYERMWKRLFKLTSLYEKTQESRTDSDKLRPWTRYDKRYRKLKREIDLA